ncbi:hypothetical protein [Companilactobacillus keshanensis]|uniref:hypothetical protein n=1 Tax=Companilactobacillus keshanensis TaxID=2486003 RepID=UPI001CDC0515|nr:hypothetical protein [Companilactobacillus keshanensis]
MDKKFLRPLNVVPTIMHLISGTHNYISNNNVIATETSSGSGDSAFNSQVDALLTTGESKVLYVKTVVVEDESKLNTILDSGTDEQVIMDKSQNAFRATPVI